MRELDEKGFDAIELPPFPTNVVNEDWCDGGSAGGRTSEGIVVGVRSKTDLSRYCKAMTWCLLKLSFVSASTASWRM